MTMNIEELLPVTDLYKKLYLQQIESGKKYLTDKNIVILSLVRNCGDRLQKNINKFVTFADTYFKNYTIIFYENDSTDDTVNILRINSEKNDNIKFHSFTFNNEFYKSIKDLKRIKYLSDYRNSLKDISKNYNSDFTIVVDFDFEDISLNGILNSFGWIASNENISAMAGNSFLYREVFLQEDQKKYKNLLNYDSFAFRSSWWTDFHSSHPSPLSKIDPMLWFTYWILPVGSNPINVNSSFGGCCIYKSTFYNDQSVLYNHVDCEHVCFHYNMLNKHKSFKLYLNPSQIMLVN